MDELINEERKKEVISVCLNQFINTGLYETTTRDLSKALKLQNAGVYYYFKTKDDTVVVCAEEAAKRLEDSLIAGVISDMKNQLSTEQLVENLFARAKPLRPMMKFFINVYTTIKYEKQMKEVIVQADQRNSRYLIAFANELNCDSKCLRKYIYLCVTTMMNYLVFENYESTKIQMLLLFNEIKKLKK